MREISLTFAGIVLPAILITLVVRRFFERVSWSLVAFMLAVVLLFIGRGVFTPDMPVPLDEVVRGYPYRGLFGSVTAKNYLTNDTVKQILPWMQTAREQLGEWRAPLWNPYLFGGYPLLGNGQSAPFSPFFLLTLFVPLPKQIVAMAGLKLFVSLLFGYMVVRREGAGPAASLFASVVSTFAIFNNCFLYYPMTAVTLLLPAAAYAVLLCLRRRSGAPFLLVALVIASLMAGGHPESVVHVAMAVVALVAIEWLAPQWADRRFSGRDFLRVVVAALAGLALSAPAWVPMAEQVPVSIRVESLRMIQAAPPFPLTALWAMLNPDGFGNPAHGNWNWIFSYTHVASLYLGLIVTALIPAALISRRASLRDRLLVMAIVLFFLASMDWIIGRVFYAVPPMSWVAHDRLRFVVCFLAAIVAARMLTRFEGGIVAITLASSVLVGSLSVYVFIKLLGRTLTWWSSAGIVGLVIFCLVTAFRRRWVPAAALVLTTIELLAFSFDYNALTPRRYYAPELPIVNALKAAARAAPSEPFRVLGLDWVFLPNAAAHYQLEDVRGSDPMQWAEYARFFRVTEATDKDRFEIVRRIVDPASNAIDFLNVRYLLTEPASQLGGKWDRIYAGKDGELYENRQFIPRFFAPRMMRRVQMGDFERELAAASDFQSVPLVSGRGLPPVITNPDGVVMTSRREGPARFRLRVSTPAKAFIASSQPAMRWWRVEVNGKRVQTARVNGAFIGFGVPAGTSNVTVVYRSESYRLSVVLALVILVLAIIGSWRMSAFRNRSDGGRGAAWSAPCGSDR